MILALRGLRLLLALAALFVFASNSLRARSLQAQETEHVRVIYYNPAHAYLVPHLLRSCENALAFHHKVFGYTPTDKVTILLEDFGDFGHGGATTIPKNFIRLGIAPFSYVYETLPANERMSWISNHETVHVVMGDKPGNPEEITRKIFFGKVLPNSDDPVSIGYSYLTSPREYAGRWYHEGIASFMETWMAGGVGRALGGYDEMVFRAMVRDDAYIYDVIGLESEGSTINFQVGAISYLYGTRFMTYLARQHGPEKLLQWVTRTQNSKAYFTSQFRNVYGVTLTEEWRRWIDYERRWQAENLKLIRQYPVTAPKHISERTLGSVSRGYYEPSTKSIYAAIRYPGQMAQLAAIHADTGEVEHLHDVKDAALYYVTSLAFDAAHRKLYFASDNHRWRDLNVYDIETHKTKKLISDFRTGDLAFSRTDESLWGIMHHNGLSKLVRIPPPYDAWQVVHEFPYGTDLFDIDVSPDGQALTGAISDMAGRQKLVRFSVEKLMASPTEGDVEYEVLNDFEYNSPENFVYSPDGRYLYGASYYTGASNIFRYDFQTKQMDVLSNAETGLFRPLPLEDGRLFALEYTAKGFVPSLVPTEPLKDVSAVKYLGQDLVERYPVFKTWKLPPSTNINIQEKTTYSGVYSPFRRTRLVSAFPIVQGYKDTAAGGMRLEFLDPLRVSSLNVTASYSPDTSLPLKERFHAGFVAQYWNWKLTGTMNNADFYDLFGPTKVSRKGYTLRVDHTKSLIYDNPRMLDLTWSIAGYAGMERLPDYQNINTSFSRFGIGRAALKYSYLDRSLGAVDDEKGTKWNIGTRVNYAGSTFYPQMAAGYDRGFLLPINHLSLWVRTSAGQSWGDPNVPFANFYFGGFGNNWVDHEDASRYREYYSFPGKQLNEISAKNFGKGMVELNLPPRRFRRLGTTSVYCNWSRLSLFSQGLITNLSDGPNREGYANLGAQVDFQLVIFTYLSSTFSVGYAEATNREGRTSGEFMISLKIL